MGRLRSAFLGLVASTSLIALAGSAIGEDSVSLQDPIWDGREHIQDYARRMGLNPVESVDIGNGIVLELVLVPAGKFMMGSAEPTEGKIGTGLIFLSAVTLLALAAPVLVGVLIRRKRLQFSLGRLSLAVLCCTVGLAGYFLLDVNRQICPWEKEKPRREVTISTPFFLGKFEVTQEQYKALIGTNPSCFKGLPDAVKRPVETVSWEEARVFCEALAQKVGREFRLPTEAEWEVACRAGSDSAFHSGNSSIDLDRVGWCFSNSKNQAQPIGKKLPNAFGLYDMHGNVCEWCADWFFESYYQYGARLGPAGPSSGTERVYRGGSYDQSPRKCRSACRRKRPPGLAARNIGFRVAASIPAVRPSPPRE